MKKLGIYSLILIFIDQIIKIIVDSNMIVNSSIKLISNVFNITYVRNTGAAFSILENNTFLLIIISIVALTLILFYLSKKKLKNIEILIYSFIISGIVGNLIDRIIHGYVIDYLDFRLINFPIFNLADILIVIGCFILIIYLSIEEKNARIQNK